MITYYRYSKPYKILATSTARSLLYILVEKTVNFSNTAIILVLLVDEIRWFSILCVILYISALECQRELKFVYEVGCRGKHEDLNCLEAMFSLQNRSLSVYAGSLKEWVTEGKSEPVSSFPDHTRLCSSGTDNDLDFEFLPCGSLRDELKVLLRLAWSEDDSQFPLKGWGLGTAELNV